MWSPAFYVKNYGSKSTFILSFMLKDVGKYSLKCLIVTFLEFNRIMDLLQFVKQYSTYSNS